VKLRLSQVDHGDFHNLASNQESRNLVPFLFSGDFLLFASCLGVALGISAGLTPLVARWASAHGMVALPRQDRWHRAPTPLLGGIAIFLSSGTVILWFARGDLRLLALVAGGAILFITGLI